MKNKNLIEKNLTLKVIAHLALLLMSIIYAANYSIAKIPLEQVDNITPSFMVACRIIIAGSLFWLVSSFFFDKLSTINFIRNRRARNAYIYKFKRNSRYFLLCGLFLVPLSQVLFFEGLQLTSAVNASLMRIGTPIMVLLFAIYARQEKLEILKVIGLILAGSGAFLLVTNGELLTLKLSWLGDTFVFLSGAAFAGYMIYSKKLMNKGYSSVAVLKWSFLIGGIFFIILEYVRSFDPNHLHLIQQFALISNEKLPPIVIYSLIFVFVFATFFTFLLNISALDKVPPSAAGAYNYVQPLIAACIATMFFEFQITTTILIGFVLVFLGIFQLNRDLIITVYRKYKYSLKERGISKAVYLKTAFRIIGLFFTVEAVKKPIPLPKGKASVVKKVKEPIVVSSFDISTSNRNLKAKSAPESVLATLDS